MPKHPLVPLVLGLLAAAAGVALAQATAPAAPPMQEKKPAPTGGQSGAAGRPAGHYLKLEMRQGDPQKSAPGDAPAAAADATHARTAGKRSADNFKVEIGSK
jgi:hypothetical protein